MSRRTILILTIRFGAGHHRAAEAVAQACKKTLLEFEPRIIDITPLMPRWFRWIYVDLYILILRNIPSLWRWFEKKQRQQDHTAPLWALRATARRVFKKVEEFDVAAMVSTEVGVNEIASILKIRHCPSIPLLAVLTDYDVDRAWVQNEVDFYCAGSTEIQAELLAAGAPADKVKMTGIPIDERFVRPPEGPIQPRWEAIFPPKPRILLAGGGEGLLSVEEILLKLDAIVNTATVTVLVGNNRKLHQRLTEFTGLKHIRLNVRGWTDDMPQLLQTHDLLISKPGGISLTEAMAAGLPILACAPLPGSEFKHSELIENWGIGLAAKEDKDFLPAAEKLLSDEALRKRCAENAHRMYLQQHLYPMNEVLKDALKASLTPDQQLQKEFNEWASTGRGEQMEEHHSHIAQTTLDQMPWLPHDCVLDLGCGTGWASRRIAEKVPQGRVHGVDIADEMIRRARAHPQNPAHLSFRVASVEALPFGNNQFDKIFSCESFYYYPDLKRALDEILRVLKPGGKFFCLVNLFKENPYTHIWVDLLKVKAHLLGTAEYEKLFGDAGFVEIRTSRIPDLTSIDERSFKPGWGVKTLEDLRKARAIGALLVVGSKRK